MKDSNSQGELEKRTMAITTGSWVRGVVVIAVAIALYFIRDIILAVVASIVIASALEPAAIWAKQKRIPRLPTMLVIYILVGLIMAGLFYFLFLPLLGEFSSFLRSFPEYSTSISSGSVWNNLSGSIAIEDIVLNINSLIGSFSRGVFSSASIIFGGLFSFILIVVLSFYLSVQEGGVEKFLRIVTPWKHEKYIVHLWRRSQRKIGLWMQGQLLLAVIIMVLVYLGLMLLGVEHALVLAVAAGVLEIIPLFGPILASIPAILIAFVGGGMTLALLVGGLFIIIQQFENQLIYPLVVKKVVGVPPIVSIIALLIGGKLAGFIGILISVPIAAILMELFNDIEQRKVARQKDMEELAS